LNIGGAIDSGRLYCILPPMALYIPHRCPKCFESVTLIQTLDKEDMPKGKAQGHCVICGWMEETEMYPKQEE